MLRSWPIVAVAFLSACTQLESAHHKLNLPQTFFTPGQGGPIPSTDQLSNSCQSSPDFDVCLFRKNPVAQEGRAISVENLENFRRFGVKIRGLPNGVHLENLWIRVFALSGSRASLLDVRRFKAPLSDQQSYGEQLSAYYWANRLLEYLQNQVGAERTPLRGLNVYPDDAFTGYVAKTKSIHLEKTPGRLPKALQADVVTHLVGQALADALTDQKLFPASPAQHNDCLQKPHGCCASSLGCSNALASAFGDYVVGVLFPDSARLGETLSGQRQGQSLCGFTRDLSNMASTSAATAFSACSAKGDVTLMGLWYAGQWWAMRKAALAADPKSAPEIDSLFFEHAKAWRADSTFQDAKVAAQQVAKNFKNGKYSALLRQHFP